MTKRDIVNKLIATYEAKNRDYGNSAHRTFVEFGEVALVIRISDKLSRLKTLCDGEERCVKDESILDTIGDAVTYLCMLAADIDCDIPELPEEERLAMDDNIENTIVYLEWLANSDTELEPDIMAAYREVLLAIWRGITNPEVRLDEYLFLAEQLLAEYEWRVNERGNAN